MEEPSCRVPIMFGAKLTSTPGGAHAGVIGENASVDEATGEMKEESEKEVPESQIGISGVTASVDEAVGEMKEQSKKEVPKSQTVIYKPELLHEVLPEMQKRKRCPAKVVQSPYSTVFDSVSSSDDVAAKE
ncbi:hypothetical protein A4A49_00175 [Nicotiana attenuata]|uniref:Uncharacterized protein n=1 Tax=Nicotiana attenuata TaxID=49451 RepID=A0A1J6J4D1_NICAT|nr:hypothetical protein A4A49_00175 [Nicotiana attenuata]